ncbi:MAG TPA: hypothetical protein VKZ18_24805 [Polyangia bacterium]|nr:hypothetical protein [Polyangia bacterium]
MTAGRTRAFAALSAAERHAGVEALGRAVADVAARTGRAAHELQVLGTAHAHELVSDGAGWWMRLEHPRYSDLAQVPRVDRLGATIVDDARADMFTAGEHRLHALAEALALLAGSDNPEAVLADRRTRLAERRRREAETRAAGDTRLAEAQEAHRVFVERNARRLRLWEGLTRLQQALHVAAGEPDTGAALRKVADLLGQSERRPLDLPPNFHAELAL